MSRFLISRLISFVRYGRPFRDFSSLWGMNLSVSVYSSVIVII